jgi:hypothetical protein
MQVFTAVRYWDNWESDIGERFIGAFETLQGAKAYCEAEYPDRTPEWKESPREDSAYWGFDSRRQDGIDIELYEVGP